MNITGIKETCIYIKDIDRTKAFYHVKLGLDIISESAGRHIFFRAGQSVLLCFMAEATLQETELPPHGANGIIHYAFEATAAGYESVKKLVTDAGITITHEHVWPHGHRSFYFEDPDQHVVEVVEQGMWH